MQQLYGIGDREASFCYGGSQVERPGDFDSELDPYSSSEPIGRRFFTGIFGVPQPHRRHVACEFLGQIDALWLYIGNFNQLLVPEEKLSGSKMTKGVESFMRVIQECGFIDIPLHNNWYNMDKLRNIPVQVQNMFLKKLKRRLNCPNQQGDLRK